jgi:hypothetical protein
MLVNINNGEDCRRCKKTGRKINIKREDKDNMKEKNEITSIKILM